MYLTYDSHQISYGTNTTTAERQNQTPFRPRWLIRIKDMVKIPGDQVPKEDKYCALSYSWTWSGERVTDEQTGNQTVKDQGKHQIISDGETRLVRFKGVLQKVAQDLNVKYLWFERICVDMDQEEDKLTSLRTIDLTYSQADFTIALVPEMEASLQLKNATSHDQQKQLYVETLEDCLDKMIKSEWSTRVWLLAEALMSHRILYLGKNVHIWSDGLDQYTALIRPTANVSLETIRSLSGGKIKDVSKILWHAHRRNTSLDHDRIFALIHIFAPIIDMPITYEPELSRYMIEFYTRLIQKDWTMLCFGKNRPDYPNSMGKYASFMPSWSGVLGTHAHHASMKQISKSTKASIVVECTSAGTLSIESGSLSFLLGSDNITLDPINTDTILADEEALDNHYGITWTHRCCQMRNKTNRVLLSLTVEKPEEWIILDIPFVWETCVVRPVITRKKDSSFYQSIGLSAVLDLSSETLGCFGPMSGSALFNIQ